jgi:ArsR family transcriptional regulator
MREVEQRLKHLVDSDVCLAENLEEYREDLIQLAREKADVNQSRKQSRFFKALSDEKRIMILKLLAVREMCVCELMIALEVTQPNLSHHLKILENQGFVNRRKDGKWAYYSLTDSRVIEQLIRMELL